MAILILCLRSLVLLFHLRLNPDIQLTFTSVVLGLAEVLIIRILIVVAVLIRPLSLLIQVSTSIAIGLRSSVLIEDPLATVDVMWPVAYFVQGIEDSAWSAVLNVGRSIRTIQELVAVDGMLHEARVASRTLDLGWRRLCFIINIKATSTRQCGFVKILSLRHTIDVLGFQSTRGGIVLIH